MKSLLLTIIPLVIALAGCGTAGPDFPIAPVSVIVKYKGEPVPGALVTFMIRDRPPPAYGTTDASGKAVLMSGEFSGAIVGSHVVLVTKQEIDNAVVAADQETEAYDPTQGSPVPKIKDLLPKKYNSVLTTDLTAEVLEGKDNEFTFELLDK